MPLKRPETGLIRPENAAKWAVKRRGFLAALGALILRPAMALATPQPLVRQWQTAECTFGSDVFGPDAMIGPPRYFGDVYLDIAAGRSCEPLLVQIDIDGRPVRRYDLGCADRYRRIHMLPLDIPGERFTIKIAAPSKFRLFKMRVGVEFGRGGWWEWQHNF